MFKLYITVMQNVALIYYLIHFYLIQGFVSDHSNPVTDHSNPVSDPEWSVIMWDKAERKSLAQVNLMGFKVEWIFESVSLEWTVWSYKMLQLHNHLFFSCLCFPHIRWRLAFSLLQSCCIITTQPMVAKGGVWNQAGVSKQLVIGITFILRWLFIFQS